MSNGLQQELQAYGVDVGGGWVAYGYGLYRDDGYRIFLDQRIQPGDGFDSIADWRRQIRDRYGEYAADAFEQFAAGIFHDPWPETRAEIRNRLIDVGIRHRRWPPPGQPDMG